MSLFVVDASAALAWFFEDEAGGWADKLLERLRQNDQIVVPAHWPTEISNGFLVAVRRKRVRPAQPALFWDELARLPIEVEPPLTPVQAKAVLAISEKHNLTAYDAAYIELARRRHLPLGTLDIDLRKAAELEGVNIL